MNLAELLDDTERFLRRFVVFQNVEQSAACALWVAHCYVVDVSPTAAYLRIRSAVEESGKTLLLEVLGQLVRKHGVAGVSMTPAVVFRLRDRVGPVAILVDELDQTIRKRQDESARDLVAIINAGYRRGAVVYRTVGANHEPAAFKCFGPAALAGIGELDPTTESRSIPIVLDRKERGTAERWLPAVVDDEIDDIVSQLGMWAESDGVRDVLATARPEYPPSLKDRQVEAWWQLLGIADLAGGWWPERAREAATTLHGTDESTMSLSVLLLSHIRQVFEEDDADRLESAELVKRLVGLEAGPWGRWWGKEAEDWSGGFGRRPQAAMSDLAAKLRALNIRPGDIRTADGATRKGYRRDWFEAVWRRYLPQEEGLVSGQEGEGATLVNREDAAVSGLAGGGEG